MSTDRVWGGIDHLTSRVTAVGTVSLPFRWVARNSAAPFSTVARFALCAFQIGQLPDHVGAAWLQVVDSRRLLPYRSGARPVIRRARDTEIPNLDAVMSSWEGTAPQRGMETGR